MAKYLFTSCIPYVFLVSSLFDGFSVSRISLIFKIWPQLADAKYLFTLCIPDVFLVFTLNGVLKMKGWLGLR